MQKTGISCDNPSSEDMTSGDDISLSSLSVLSIKSCLSLNTSSSSDSIFCRICHQNDTSDMDPSDMISPCKCMGSMANVHQQCLQRWASLASSSSCDICGFRYKSRQKYPTVWKWIRRNVFTKEFTVEVVITALMAISTPLIIMATIMSVLVSHTSRVDEMKLLVYSLLSITMFSWILYIIMFICTFRFLRNSFNKWRNQNIIIELVWTQQSEDMDQNCVENYI